MSEESDTEEIDRIFAMSDDLFRSGKFAEFDDMLLKLRLEDLSSTVIISWLTAAAMPKRVERKEMLPSRPEFIRLCRIELMKRHPDRIDGLMMGLDK